MYVKDLDINVVDATERRILEAFNKNQKVAVSFSGGNTPYMYVRYADKDNAEIYNSV
mgnify:CR=1 FL=1